MITVVSESEPDLCERLHQVGHHLILVLCQNVVQCRSSLAVFSEHEEARVLLIRRWRSTVVLKVLHGNAALK